MDVDGRWRNLPSGPSLKHLTDPSYGIPPEQQKAALQDLTRAHVDSFNYAALEGLSHAVQVSAVHCAPDLYPWPGGSWSVPAFGRSGRGGGGRGAYSMTTNRDVNSPCIALGSSEKKATHKPSGVGKLVFVTPGFIYEYESGLGRTISGYCEMRVRK